MTDGHGHVHDHEHVIVDVIVNVRSDFCRRWSTRRVPEPSTTPTAAPYLDCERLDCYRIAVEFQVLAAGLCRKPRLGSLRDQLDRASVSIVLNIAEGVGRTSGPDKAHFFAIARGSATECAAVLDLLLARGLVGPSEHRHARGLLVRVVQMMTRLIARWTRFGQVS